MGREWKRRRKEDDGIGDGKGSKKGRNRKHVHGKTL